MKTAFQKSIIAFLFFVFCLTVTIVFLIRQQVIKHENSDFSQFVEMVDFTGILISTLSASVLILISVGLIFWIAKSWTIEQPNLADRITKMATIINITIILIFGGLAGGLIVLRTLWTIGFF